MRFYLFNFLFFFFFVFSLSLFRPADNNGIMFSWRAMATNRLLVPTNRNNCNCSSDTRGVKDVHFINCSTRQRLFCFCGNSQRVRLYGATPLTHNWSYECGIFRTGDFPTSWNNQRNIENFLFNRIIKSWYLWNLVIRETWSCTLNAYCLVLKYWHNSS